MFQRVLEKCGFAPLGIIGEEAPRFNRDVNVNIKMFKSSKVKM